MWNSLRKIFKRGFNWIDTACIPHKHHFSLRCNVTVKNKIYKAKKCEFCNSFIRARRTDILDLDYPVIELERSPLLFGIRKYLLVKTW